MNKVERLSFPYFYKLVDECDNCIKAYTDYGTIVYESCRNHARSELECKLISKKPEINKFERYALINAKQTKEIEKANAKQSEDLKLYIDAKLDDFVAKVIKALKGGQK